MCSQRYLGPSCDEAPKAQLKTGGGFSADIFTDSGATLLEIHGLLCHAYQQQTCQLAENAGLALRRRWKPRETCSKGNEHRLAVPKSTENGLDIPLGRLFVDFTEPEKHESSGGRHCARIFDTNTAA